MKLCLSTYLDIFYLVSLNDKPAPGEDAVGEASIQVDLFTHPGTGEHKVTVKGQYHLEEIMLNNVLFIREFDHSIKSNFFGPL